MSNNVRFDNFVSTVLNMDLATQHLSTSLNAKAKPGFLERFFDWILGTNKDEKNSVVAQIDALITGNEAALKGFRQASPAQFDVFKAKLGILGEKLQRNLEVPDRISFVAKAAYYSGSQVVAFRQAPAPAPKPPVKAKPAAVVPRTAPVVVAAAPVVAQAPAVVAAKPKEVVKGDPKLRVADQENLNPQVREASAEQIMAAFGADTTERLIYNYGQTIAKKVFAHFNSEVLGGHKFRDANGQRRIFAHANAWLLDTFIARNLPKGMTKADALSILTGKPVHQIDAEFIKLFRSGEFIINSPTAIADLKKVLTKKVAGKNSSAA